MRYTAVFYWPDGKAPGIRRGDDWIGGELCEVSFTDSLADLRRLREAARNYCDEYLRDEIDHPELCMHEDHRAAVEALWAAVVGA